MFRYLLKNLNTFIAYFLIQFTHIIEKDFRFFPEFSPLLSSLHGRFLCKRVLSFCNVQIVFSAGTIPILQKVSNNLWHCNEIYFLITGYFWVSIKETHISRKYNAWNFWFVDLNIQSDYISSESMVTKQYPSCLSKEAVDFWSHECWVVPPVRIIKRCRYNFIRM